MLKERRSVQFALVNQVNRPGAHLGHLGACGIPVRSAFDHLVDSLASINISALNWPNPSH